VSPPKSDGEEVQILDAEQIALVLCGLAGHWLHPIAVFALGTGCRRGELLALRWQDIDLDRGEVRVERSLEQTRAGLRFKAPKNKFSRRTLSLGPSTIATMRAHRVEQMEIKMAVGHRSDLVFATVDGNPRSPDHVTTDWRRVLAAKRLPSVNFHALRHTHASALIARVDIVSVSRRLGHGSPNITLSTSAHLFTKTDTKAADAIERMLAPKLAPK
jgi:integrase